MLKKRLIFTLLHSNGSFMLSRNFRLQRVGNTDWLNENYNFSTIAASIDELIILNTSREDGSSLEHFLSDVNKVTKGCFMPLALGGKIRCLEDIRLLMQGGADKVVLNTALFTDGDFVRAAVAKYGSQCIIASIDYQKNGGGYSIFMDCGTKHVEGSFEKLLTYIAGLGVGEVYLNSIDKDGTGQGYCLSVLEHTAPVEHLPIIMAGGAGNFGHLQEGLNSRRIDAVATANLFNFVGDGLPSARHALLENGHNLAKW